MNDWRWKVLAVAAAALIYRAVRLGHYVFEIRIERGVPRLHRGKVPLAFLDGVAEICRDAGVARGWIGGVERGRSIFLRFSRDIPPTVHQRFRNAWGISR